MLEPVLDLRIGRPAIRPDVWNRMNGISHKAGHKSPVTARGRRRAQALVHLPVVLCVASLVGFTSTGFGQSSADRNGDDPSYFEFGTVVGLEQRSVEVQSFDVQKQRPVQHSFMLTRDTRADLVHVGDVVEVIYVSTGGEMSLRRLIVLYAGVPRQGPPPAAGRSDGAAAGLSQGAIPQGVVPHSAPTHAGRSATQKKSVPPVVRTKVADPPPAAPATRADRNVDLGNPNGPRPAAVTQVPLGVASAATARLNAPGSRSVAHDVPSAECNRSSADWPTQPLSLAVLDFRYPTEHEEEHDNGTTGGGSGTAVADMVFARLEEVQEFAVQRGDRRRLDRTDIAGAARLGRQLGVDAVLAGTFFPVEEPASSDDDFGRPRAYELRAGLVDTCTGQVLMKLSSDSCSEAPAGGAVGCTRYTVTAKDAANPAAHGSIFQAPLDALLSPLEHNSTVPGQTASVGVVTATSGDAVTMRVTADQAAAQLKAGDQLALHATRLAKNPTTYTLNILRDQEIGRIAVRSVQDGTITGAFSGDIPPKAGDLAEVVTER